MIKLAITGCQGRMGMRIAELASVDKDFEIVALIESPDKQDIPHAFYGIPIVQDINAIKGADVLIDFTLPHATDSNIKACREYGVRYVVGTTGLTGSQLEAIDHLAKKVAVIQSTNMSVGVNTIFALIEKAGEILKNTDLTLNITETHHVHKKDAPSGTAKTMGEVATAVTGKPVEFESVREGEVVGYHKLTIDTSVDTIEISHAAKTRDIFVEGALVAAKWVAQKKKGRFNMRDVLGIK